MPFKLPSANFAFFVLLLVSSQTQAQEIAKMHHDYHSGSVTYSPDDPWTRSKLFNAHTGHSGKFYNCDSEECKRYSPYIHWQTNCQSLTPPTRGLLNQLRRDQGKIQQRIADGAGPCSCSECQTARGTRNSLANAEPQIDGIMIVNRLPQPAGNGSIEASPLPSVTGRSVRQLADDIKSGLVSHPELYSITEEELTKPDPLAVAKTNRSSKPNSNEVFAPESAQWPTVAPRMGLLSQHPHQQNSGGNVQGEVAQTVPTKRIPARKIASESSINKRTMDQEIVGEQKSSSSVYGRSMIQFERPAQNESTIKPQHKSNFSDTASLEVVAQSTIAPAAGQRLSQPMPARTAAATPLSYFAPK